MGGDGGGDFAMAMEREAAEDAGAGGDAFDARAGAAFLNATMSVTPRQPRSLTTLERLIEATRSIGLRHGEGAVTLKAVAGEANVGLKSIYRYFSSPADLIRVAIRMDLIRKFKAMQRRIGRTDYADAEALAADISARVVGGFRDESVVSRRFKQRLIENYTTIAHGEIDATAVAIVAAMRRCRMSGAAEAGVAEIAMALAGVGGAARQAFLHHPETFDDGRFQRIATAQIMLGLASCRSSEPPSRSGF